MEKRLSPKKVLKNSARLFVCMTLFDIVASVISSLFFSGYVLTARVLDALGFLVLLEAMVFFFAGGAVDMLHSAKGSMVMKILKLRDKAWTMNESLVAERRALVYVLTGLFLILELILLSLLGI
ncbi:hypothetical protein KEJ18_01875 [Candidatus Bathyarchaeota archaeon]|nr:hypothetical protein [Candidatus Bathyarchaeota archaeon]